MKGGVDDEEGGLMRNFGGGGWGMVGEMGGEGRRVNAFCGVGVLV